MTTTEKDTTKIQMEVENQEVKRDRKCSVSGDAPQHIVMSSVFIENCNKTDVGGLTLPKNVENVPPFCVEEKFDITIHGPATVETVGRTPNVIVKNYGPVIHFSDEMLQSFRNDGTLERLMETMYRLKIETSKDVLEECDGYDPDSTKPVRQRSIRSHAQKSITIDKCGVTLSVNDKSYSLTSLDKSSFLDDLVPRQYKWISRTVLTAFVMACTFGIIYVLSMLVFH